MRVALARLLRAQYHCICTLLPAPDQAVLGGRISGADHLLSPALVPTQVLFDLITAHHQIKMIPRSGSAVLCSDYEETNDTSAELDRFVSQLNMRERQSRTVLKAAADGMQARVICDS